MNLRGVMDILQQELPCTPVPGAPLDPALQERICGFLDDVKLNPREWKQHAHFRKGRYTRSIVGYSPGQFIALLLCWAPGQQSPIHDHTGAHCFVKMLEGRLREERFDWSANGGASEVVGLAELSATDANLPSVAFSHDDIGLHRIRNPCTEEGAVSLHIYSPPFVKCQVFPPTGSAPRTASMVSAFLSTSPALDKLTITGNLPLAGFCEYLHRLRSNVVTVQADEVRSAMEQLQFGQLELAAHCSELHFSEFGVVHSLAYVDEKFSVVVSCWSPGQKMAPHGLGLGRTMWLKAIKGSASMKILSGRSICPGSMHEADEQHAIAETTDVVRWFGQEQLQISAQDDGPTVTVQVYSPPLTQFAFQTENGVNRFDIPRLACSPPFVDQELSITQFLTMQGRQFLSLQELDDLISRELSTSVPSHHVIAALLRKTGLNRDEWRSMLADAAVDLTASSGGEEPCIVHVAQHAHHSLLLALWQPGQTSMGSSFTESWTLVLEGELEEETYFGATAESGSPMRISSLKEGSLTFMDDTTVARRHCDNDVPCVSLHVVRNMS